MSTTKDVKMRQPKSLWWFACTMALYMWVFASLLADITLYLKHVPGITTREAYGIFGAFASLAFVLPLPAGYVSERFGYRRACVVGLIFCLIGIVGLIQNQLIFTYLGLSSFLVGGALFATAIMCLLDANYTKQDIRREAGFTYMYLIFNIGGVFGIFINGSLHALFSYQVEFSVDMILIVLTMVAFSLSFKKLEIAQGRAIKPQLNWRRQSLTLCLIMGSSVVAAFVTFLLVHYRWNEVLEIVFAGIAVVTLLFIARQQPNKSRRQGVYAFIILCTISVVFWSLYNLEPSLLSVFIKTNVNRHLFDLHLPADVFFGFDGVFIAIFGVGMSYLWVWLARKKIDISLPVKFSFSLVLIGLGYLLLDAALHWNGLKHLLPAHWIVFGYMFFALGELLVGPIGFSMVGRLAPQNREGLFMGVWQLFIGLGAVAGGLIAQYTVIPKAENLFNSNQEYGKLFSRTGIAAVLVGLLMLILSFWIKRLISEKRASTQNE